MIGALMEAEQVYISVSFWTYDKTYYLKWASYSVIKHFHFPLDPLNWNLILHMYRRKFTSLMIIRAYIAGIEDMYTEILKFSIKLPK